MLSLLRSNINKGKKTYEIMENKILTRLEVLSRKKPEQVIKELKIGSKVSKSMGLKYIIDNPEIYTQLGNFPEGFILYNPIRNHFDSPEGIKDLFRDRKEIPFSRVYQNQAGECLEKAILLHLSAQKSRRAFLINGCLCEDSDYASPHAYNILFDGERGFLIDVENPLEIDSTGKVIRPYTAPILEIKGKENNFIVPEEWRQGRNYSVF